MEAKVKPIHAKPSLYAFYFQVIKEIGIKYGYNIVLHGSMNRDLDLIAIAWIDEIGDKELMIDEIAEVIGGFVMMQGRTKDNLEGFRFSEKPNNRKSYIININRDIEMKYDGMIATIKNYANPQFYIDISVI